MTPASQVSFSPLTIMMTWVAWVAQLVKQQTLDFNSGHDLTVRGLEHQVRLRAASVEPGILSLSLRLSLKVNK